MSKRRTTRSPSRKRSSATSHRTRRRSFSRNSGAGKPGTAESATADGDGRIRLNKYIAASGVCSRREADGLIAAGLISVNSKVVTALGSKVDPGDTVRYDGRVLHAERPVYVLLNKPRGYITTASDPSGRRTVMDLIGTRIRQRIYPVGRLDRNTTGLLLLTNDGELAGKLAHPSYRAKKIYKIVLDKPLAGDDHDRILAGVRLEEGKVPVDELAVLSPDRKTLGMELHIGWNRVVRRVFEKLGYKVERLDRTSFAGVDKRDLPRGKWRFLTDAEVIRLKHLT